MNANGVVITLAIVAGMLTFNLVRLRILENRSRKRREEEALRQYEKGLNADRKVVLQEIRVYGMFDRRPGDHHPTATTTWKRDVRHVSQMPRTRRGIAFSANRDIYLGVSTPKLQLSLIREPMLAYKHRLLYIVRTPSFGGVTI